jgi:hypothetical protein
MKAGSGELHLRGQLRQESVPAAGFDARRRQLGEARIAEDEALQVAGALCDRREDLRQPFGLAARHQLRARMRQRRQRRQRVVQLVADHADHLLPGLHFLAPQFDRQLAQQQQFVAPPVQAEIAARQVVDLFVLALAGGEQAVTAARDRFAQRDT